MEEKFVVTEKQTAAYMGSGDLAVLATPALVAMLENVAMKTAYPLLQEGETTVGGQIMLEHLRPTAVGDTIIATATLVKQEGRKLEFHLSASDSHAEVARGTHLRFIVSREKFMNKL